MDLSLYNGWSDIDIRMCARDTGFLILLAAITEKYIGAENYDITYMYPKAKLTQIPSAQANLQASEHYINELIPYFVNHTVFANYSDAQFTDIPMWTRDSIYAYIGEEPITPEIIQTKSTYRGYPIAYYLQKQKILNLLIWTRVKDLEDQVKYDFPGCFGGGNNYENSSSLSAAYNAAVASITHSDYYWSKGIMAEVHGYVSSDNPPQYYVNISGTNKQGYPYLESYYNGYPQTGTPARQIRYGIDFYYRFDRLSTSYTNFTFSTGDLGYVEGWNKIASISPENCFDESYYKWQFNPSEHLPACPSVITNEYSYAGYQAFTGGYVKRFDVTGGFKFR